MKIIDMKSMGSRIQECRRKLNMTQQDVYTILNISQNHYSRIENGHVGMSFEILLEICEILHVSTDYILTGKIHLYEDSPIIPLFNSCTFEQQQHILNYINLFLEYETQKDTN